MTAAPTLDRPRVAPSLLDPAGNAAFYGYALFLLLAGGLAGILAPRWGPLSF